MSLTPKNNYGPHRWYDGLTGRNPEDMLFEIAAGGPVAPRTANWYEFKDDFFGFTASASGVSGWHLDESGSSTTAATVQAAGGGVVLIAPGSTGGNNTHYHWANNTTPSEVIKLVGGKRWFMEVVLKIEDADQNLIIAGAHVTQDDPWNTEPSDQAVFRTLAADPDALQFAIGKTNSTEVTVALGDLEDDTWVRLLALYDGYDTVHALRFDSSGTLTNAGSVSVTSSAAGDLMPDTEMAPAFGVEAVDTGADDFSLDLLRICVER